jgi:hypothetical protein
MNTNVSIYKEPVVLQEGEIKEQCDCGGEIITRRHTKENNTRVQVFHCTLCTQDYFKLESVGRKTDR